MGSDWTVVGADWPYELRVPKAHPLARAASCLPSEVVLPADEVAELPVRCGVALRLSGQYQTWHIHGNTYRWYVRTDEEFGVSGVMKNSKGNWRQLSGHQVTLMVRAVMTRLSSTGIPESVSPAMVTAAKELGDVCLCENKYLANQFVQSPDWQQEGVRWGPVDEPADS